MFFEEIKRRSEKAISFCCNRFGVSLRLRGRDFFTGFSSEKESQIGFRFTRIGIPIPNWLFSVFLIIFCLACTYLLVLLLKEILKNTTYNETIAKAEKFGNIETIDSILSILPKNEHTKGGELIFNDTLFFYRYGAHVTLAATNQLCPLCPIFKRDVSRQSMCRCSSPMKR